MADLGKGSLYFGYKRKIPSRKKSRLIGFLKRQSNTEVAFDRPRSQAGGLQASFTSWGPFLERPGNLTGLKSYFEIKFSRIVGCVLTSNEVHFVSLAENVTVNFQKF